MLMMVRLVSDDQECLVNFSKSGRLVFTYVVQSDNQCRFRASMIFGQFRDKSGRFFLSAAKEFFIDRVFLAEVLLCILSIV